MGFQLHQLQVKPETVAKWNKYFSDLSASFSEFEEKFILKTLVVINLVVLFINIFLFLISVAMNYYQTFGTIVSIGTVAITICLLLINVMK